MRPVTIRFTDGPLLANRAWATENTFERVQGWLGRGTAGPGEGLLIRPCASFHTFGMRFPLDAAFLDRRGRVLKVVPGVRPSRLVWGPWRGLFFPWTVQLLELPVGALAAADVRAGSLLEFAPRTP